MYLLYSDKIDMKRQNQTFYIICDINNDGNIKIFV